MPLCLCVSRFVTAAVKAVVLAVVLSVSLQGAPSAMAQEKAPIRVAFFNPQGADDPFWLPVERFMRAAAHDLGMEVSTYVADHDRARMIEQVRAAVSGPQKPDFIVFKNFKANAPEILGIAEEHGVKSFIFNAGLTPEEHAAHGGPRERYRHWIGSMLPGDQLAGFNLASALIAEARAKGLVNVDGKIHMAGLTGNLSDSAAVERNLGLERALEENPDVVFHQLVPARWDHAQAVDKTQGLLSRYPSISVLWAANDPMALGAIDGAVAVGRVPGKDFITGGVDWNPPALEAVKAGAMHITIGGHFMEGGWVMVLLHDYAHGADFATDGGSARYSEMAGLTRANIGKYIDKFVNEDWERVDFSRFSKVANPSLKTYDFSLERILEQL